MEGPGPGPILPGLPLPDWTDPTILDDVTQSTQTKFVGIAAITILLWDHLDSFPVEVEHIWMRPKNLVSYLFLLNRYLTPMGFSVNIFAYFSPTWTEGRCHDFIRFEGAMTLIGINVVAAMMLLRIRILYRHEVWVPRGVMVILAAQFGMNAYLLTRGEAVQHNDQSGIVSCTMIFAPEISIAASTSAWLPLVYDTVVFTLTVKKTWNSIPWHRHKNSTSFATGSMIARRLFEDGLLYFSVIMSVTMVLTLMIIFAPPGLKNITAQLQLIITVTMMSRITLNLKSQSNLDSTSLSMPRPPPSNAYTGGTGAVNTFGTVGMKSDANHTVNDNIEMKIQVSQESHTYVAPIDRGDHYQLFAPPIPEAPVYQQSPATYQQSPAIQVTQPQSTWQRPTGATARMQHPYQTAPP